MPTAPDSPAALLGADDPPPFRLLNAAARTPLLLLCDHASNAVPKALDRLGLAAQVLEGEHIAWDLGAAQLTARLAQRLDATAVLSGYSRLVIDCNRQPGDPTSIPEVSDGIRIPGNQNLTDAEAERRLEECFWPYHHAITREIARLWRHGPPPAIVSLHSFTPQLRGFEPRPWHIGVLWNHDPRLALPLLDWLREHTDYCVGDNEPYSGRSVGFTMQTHAEAAGLPHVLFEVRQDLLTDAPGLERWADVLARALQAVLADPHLHRVVHF